MKSTSKKRKHSSDSITFSDGTKIKMANSNAGSIRQKPGRGISKVPEKKQNTELAAVMVSGKDQYDDLDYPPPSRVKAFREFWGQGIGNLTERENFDASQLSLFETYCHLLVNMRRLDEFIATNGQTYRVVTVTGEIRRTHPEVMERNKTISQIAQYVKLLDFMPKKDKRKGVPKGEEQDWS